MIRAPQLVWFWRHPVEVKWYEAQCPVSLLAQVQVDRWFTRFRTKNRTLRELVDNPHPDARPKTIDGPFALKQIRGSPILMCDKLTGPFVFMDGSNRLRQILIEHDRGAIKAEETFAVIVGVHPNAREWPHWRDRLPPGEMLPGEAD